MSPKQPKHKTKFNAVDLVSHYKNMVTSDEKLSMSENAAMFEEYCRFIEDEYGLVGKIVTHRVRKDTAFYLEALERYGKTKEDEQTAENLLTLTSENKNDAKFHTELCHRLAVLLSFFSYVVLILDGYEKPDLPGRNFIADCYEVTLGKLEPWYIRKPVQAMLRLYAGKEYWKEHYFENEAIFPGNTIADILTYSKKIQQHMIKLMEKIGCHHLIHTGTSADLNDLDNPSSSFSNSDNSSN